MIKAKIFSNIIGHLPLAIAYLDRTMVCGFSNQKFNDILGLQKSEVVGQHVAHFLPDDQKTTLMPILEKAAAGKEIKHEISFIAKSGELVWAETMLVPYLEKEESLGLIIFILDVTQKRNQENDLRLFRIMLENTQDAIFLVDPNSGAILDVNNRACQNLGYPYDELIKLRLKDIEVGLPIHTVKQRQEITNLVYASDSGFIIHRGIQRRKNGTVFPVEISISMGTYANKAIMVGMSRDISSQVEIEQEKEQLVNLIENSNDIIIIANLEGRLQYMNKAALIKTGVGQESQIGRYSIFDLGETDSMLKQTILPIIEEKGYWYGYRNLINVNSKKLVPLEMNIFSLRDKMGNAIALAFVSRDISERLEAARRLQESEEKFRQLIENLEEVFWIINAHNNKIEFVSPAYEKIWGRSIQDLYKNYNNWLQGIYEIDKSRIAKSFARIAENGFDEIYRIVSLTGEVKWIHNKAFFLRDNNNNVVKYIGIARDITFEMRAQEVVRLSEEKYRILFNTLPVGVSLLDQDGNAIENNRMLRKILRFTENEFDYCQYQNREYTNVEGMPLLEHEHPWSLAIEKNQIIENQEIATKMDDGETVWLNMNASPLNVSGIAAVLTMTDISQEKKLAAERINLEKQLLQSQKMEALGTLAGGIAHDFNNILSAIIGYSDILIDSLDSQSDESNYVSQIKKSGMRAADLVRQILTFSRGGQQDYTAIDLAAVTREAYSMLRASIGNNLAIGLDIAPNLPQVKGNYNQIHQVIVNLVSNASYAIGDAVGEITLALYEQRIEKSLTVPVGDVMEPGRYVCMQVSDNGIGMTEDVKSRIFDPFFTTKPVSKGTGLGLSVVSGIIRGHGAYLDFISETEKGSDFLVYFLPTQDEESIPVLSHYTDQPLGKKHILIADDEEMILAFYRLVLEKNGYTTHCVNNGLQAWEAFNAQDYDLVLLDHNMPGMTGLTVSQKIIEQDQNIPVMLATGFSDEINEKDAKALGLYAFVLKPLTVDKLLNLVYNAFAPKQ